MSRLRDRAHAVSRSGVLPVLASERLFAIEHVAAFLDRQPVRQIEPWPELLDRLREEGIGTFADKALRRALDRIWTEGSEQDLAIVIVSAAIGRQRRSVDRALIHAYLFRHPTHHRGFDTLREAAALVADRHDWRWRERGRHFGLWEPDAAALTRKLGKELNRAELLRQAGLTGRLAEGAFAAMLGDDAALPPSSER